MATRATYCFTDQYKAKTTVYIHWDGYPDGAAVYLNATLSKPSKGNMATQFIRANDGAEITRCHTAHGDTEYCYDINGEGSEAEIFAYKCKGGRKGHCVFSGPLYQFIDKYSRCIENHIPFRHIDDDGVCRSGWFSLDQARIALCQPVDVLERAKARPNSNASCGYSVDEIKGILGVFPELSTPKIMELIG